MATNRSLRELNGAQLFQLRTNTKRLHTNIATRIAGLIASRSPIDICQQQTQLLATCVERLRLINAQYIITAALNRVERNEANEYIRQIDLFHTQTQEAVNNYVVPQPPAATPARRARAGAWHIEDSVVQQPLRQPIFNLTAITNASQLNNENLTHENAQHYVTVDDANLIPQVNNSNNSIVNYVANQQQALTDERRGHIRPQTDFAEENEAKRRRLILEMERDQNNRRAERELEDLRRRQQRIDEDLQAKIDQENRLLALNNPQQPSPRQSYHSSTPVQVGAGLFSPATNLPVIPAQHSNYGSSKDWPRIVVAPLNGDPKNWRKFDQGVQATIVDTNMPDSRKLLQLQSLLVDEIRKRNAHLFTGMHTFRQAYEELKTKYGSPGLVMQAHNTHLLTVQTVRPGDSAALFLMAADVREAVSSVPAEYLLGSTYSTVVTSLYQKLPSQLQIDWGKYSYGLKPSLPSLQDFDRWLDIVVGAEEYRGNKFVQVQPIQPAATTTRRFQSTGYGQAGSSGYNRTQTTATTSTAGTTHSPTILTHSVKSESVAQPLDTPTTGRAPIPACVVCNEDPGHRLDFCNVFKRMQVNDRATMVAENNYCFKCLYRGHYGRDCRRPERKCLTCGQSHNSLLHGANKQFSKGNHLADILTLRPLKPQLHPVLLAIVPIKVSTGATNVHSFAVLDPGSEATLATQSLATKLNLSGLPIDIRFGNFNDSVVMNSKVVSLQFSSSLGPINATEVFIVPKIDLSFRKIDWPTVKNNWSHLVNVNLPPLDTSSVEILIGIDHLSAHERLGIAEPTSGENGPTAIKTPFGWTIVGKIPAALVDGPSNKKSINTQWHTEEIALSQIADRFHSTESFGVDVSAPKTISSDDTQAIAVLKASIKFIRCGWQVDLPLRLISPIPNNRNQAVSRYFGMEKRLAKPENADYALKYNAIVLKLISSGIAEPVRDQDINHPEGMVWYLPHHFVVYPNKPGKIRVVMDWAVQFQGFVMNKNMCRGPSLIPSLVGVLLRTRQFTVAVSADIESFYHRVGVPKEQRSLQRFVFREFGTNKHLLTYQFTTLVFGAINASTSAIWALRHAVRQNKQYPDVAATIEDDYYSDNLSKSFETDEEAIQFSKHSIASLARGGFNLTGFASSSKVVLATIPKRDRAEPVRDLNFDALPTEYVLGMGWDCATDKYHLRTKQMPSVGTKRELLSALSRSFDPLGLCLPVITYAKLLFQEACNSRTSVPPHLDPLGWDEPLPTKILTKWNEYANEITSLTHIGIKRCFRPHDFPLSKCVFDLLVYCDASLSAFAAVAYLRTTCEERTHTSFVMAKGRLAPTSTISIPRLELQSAVLAARLTKTIKKELRIHISSVEYYSDSMIVIKQLLSSHLERPMFVKGRLDEILRHSKKEEWSHIDGKDNVADDGTRGLTPAQFKPDCRWIIGPSPSQKHSPATAYALDQQFEDTECVPTRIVGQTSVSSPSPPCSQPHVSKLIRDCRTDLTHLKRHVARSLRDDTESDESLTVTELEEALKVCLITAAEEAFPREIKALRQGKKLPRDSVLRNVTPFIDPVDGLLKVDGRLAHAELPEQTRHPIILAPDHRLTRLIIADAHHSIHHAGVEHTLATVRTRYYLPQGRRAIRRAIVACEKCKFNFSRPTAPRMANLPKDRLLPYVRPFSTTGLDLFGPFTVVIGRRVEKRWILIGTCFSIRAIHLELVYSLSADSCLMAVRRFIADRGHTKTSDNGTNLVATDKELAEGMANLNSKLVTEEMIDRDIKWNYSPPGGSHFGGPYERLVGSCKRSLLSVLGNRTVTDEVLLTVMKEVASLLNSRPITRVSTDPSEPEPLTPNHFILNCNHPHVPPNTEEEFSWVSRRRWKQAQFIVDQYWRRWLREYVPELIERKKWHDATRQMRVGDRVLLLDENTRRGLWPMGTVTKVFTGDGGVIRRVAVQTEKSELIRPVVKLCLISE